MRASIHNRCTLVAGLLSLMLSGVGLAAHAQGSAEHFSVSPAKGSTVSVFELQVPMKAWRHFAKAKQAAEHNHLAESERETRKAIVIAPQFAAAYLLRADLMVRDHSFEAAIESVREAIRIEPDAMWAGVVLAGAYNGLSRYEDARLVLRGLHGAEAESWQAYYEAARAAVGLNDVEAALRTSDTVLQSAPDSFADAHLVRANALSVAHRWGEAQAQMEIYLSSKEPQEHRVEVLAALRNVKREAHEAQLYSLASR